MKATGIVRNIDDLGRIVIPKEIRRTMGIKEGDPLEIYVTEEGICLKTQLTQAEILERYCEDMNDIPEIAKELIKLAITTIKKGT